MKPAAGQLIGGKYLLARPLAQGGMGELWVGHHVELDIAVAIKFLEPKLAGEPEFVRRFQREARAAARLRSAHVARIHDYGMEQGAPYIAMELLEGETLAERLAREGSLSVARLAAIVAQLAKGLGEAHAAGIVHRDLKPSNVFLARVAGEEVVKILDFGIAKELTGRAHDTAVTDSGILLGSPRYMSPEQARGGSIDHRTDLWSLGVLVFEALTGRPLFESNHQGDLIAAITGDPLPRLRDVSPELPAALERFFERALARNPEARFRRVTVLAEELSAIAEGRDAARDEPTVEMEPFDAPRSSLPPDASTRRELAGRSTPTLAVGATEPVDAGVASTITRRPRPARWYALGGVALFVAIAVVWLTRADEPAPAASAPPPAPAPAPAPSPGPTPVEVAQPKAEPSATPRPPAPRAAKAQPSAPRPSVSRDPNFGLPVKSK